jgi:hypothetical protein
MDAGPFKDFVAQLIRCERATLGLPDGGLLVGEQIYATDQGADSIVEVDRSADLGRADRTMIPMGKSVWQIRSGKRTPTKASFEAELKKEKPRACLESGGSYVFVAQQPASTRAEDEERDLRAVARKLGLPSKMVHFHAQSRLADFARRFPSLARRTDHAELGDLKTGSEWSAMRVFDAPFQEVEDRGRQIADIVAWLGRRPEGSDVRVVGAAGVGKTRLVLEALRRAGLLDLVVYSPGPGSIPAGFIPVLYAVERDAECVLVVDECRDEAAARLIHAHPELLHARVRLLTIGHHDDAPALSLGPRSTLIDVRPLDEASIEAILAESRPKLPDDRRRWVAHQTKGFVKLAEILADAIEDSPISDVGASDPLVHTRLYLEAHFTRDGSRLLEALALFTRVGVAGDARPHLLAIAKWLGLSWHRADALVEAAEKRNILARVDAHRYVTPALLAAWLVDSFVGASEDAIVDFLDTCDPHLLALAATRLQNLEREGYGQAGRTLLRRLAEPGRRLGALEGFRDPSVARAFTAIARADLTFAARHLERITSTASPADLAAGRREILWLLPDLLWEEETFEPAFATVLRLAQAECEPGIGNNATSVLGSIFLIALAPTQAPFARRLGLAVRAMRTTDAATRLLLVQAVARAFVLREVALIVPERAHGAGYPRAPGGVKDARTAALRFVADARADEDAGVRAAATGAILRHARELVAEVPVTDLLPVFTAIAGDPSHQVEVRDVIEKILVFDSARLPMGDVAALRTALERLPLDLLSRVRVEVGRWDVLSKQRAAAGLPAPQAPDDLAADVLAGDVRSALAAIFDPAAKKAGPLVTALGRRDGELEALEHVLTEGRRTGNAWLAAGYVRGLLEVDPFGSGFQLVKGGLEGDDLWLREVAARAVTSAPATAEAITMLLEQLRAGRIRPEWLAAMSFARWTATVPMAALADLLEVLSAVEGGIDVAIHAAFMAVDDGVALEPAVVDGLVLRGLDRGGTPSWEWAQLAGRTAERRPLDVAESVLGWLIQRPAFQVDQDTRAVLDRCLEHGGPQVAELFLDRVVSGGRVHPALAALASSRLLSILGTERLLAWARARGRAGQVVIAHVFEPVPSAETQAAVGAFGFDSVFGEHLAARVWSGAFVGPPSEIMDGHADQASAWANDERLDPEFRRWAERLRRETRAWALGWRERDRGEEELRRVDGG